MTFNDDNFMLKNDPAKKLYQIAKEQPIFDFHCHLNPQEIYEDKVYDNIVDLWLGGDHYKWRLMRANGVNERFITGESTPLEKFKAYAETVEKAYGNPLYHWSHLELKEVFGITEPITKDGAERLYEQLNQLIKEKEISPRYLIAKSNVKFIGTTDHPLDTLEWHKKLAEDNSFGTVVAPTFRPDEAFVDHANFSVFATRLAEITHTNVDSFNSFIDAMEKRVAYFAEHGCKASDISFGKIQFADVDEKTLDGILTRALSGQIISDIEIQQWQTGVFMALCRLYKKYNFVTQVHFGALRNNNTELASKLGADIGVDSMGNQTYLTQHLNKLLDALNGEKSLPKMIWYNLNPSYNIALANTLMNFQSNEQGIKTQLQFGAGWWFNDTKLGMISQMNAYAESGLLANFVGMLTDSRSFLSYQRHDYFRRILCSYVGQWVIDEEIPYDESALNEFIKRICYDNAAQFFK